MSNYPDENYDRNRIPRVPAAQFATIRTASFDRMQEGLARSLACYVSADDAELDRVSFLRTVISRMQDDLEHGTY